MFVVKKITNKYLNIKMLSSHNSLFSFVLSKIYYTNPYFLQYYDNAREDLPTLWPVCLYIVNNYIKGARLLGHTVGKMCLFA